MITHEQAMTADMFHHNIIRNADGTCQRWRRNGRTKTWKRMPEAFEVPVKNGLYGYGHLCQADARLFHTAADCPCETAR